MNSMDDDTVHVWYNAHRPRWSIVVHTDGLGSVKVYPDIVTASYQLGSASSTSSSAASSASASYTSVPEL